MEQTGNVMEVVGFVFVLVSASAVFLSLISWVLGKMRNPVLMSAQLVIFFLLISLMGESITELFGLEGDKADFVINAVDAMLWLSGAFTFNSALKRYIWKGVLVAEDGASKVPKLLTDFVTVFIYITVIMSVMHFVYDRPITAVAATSGVFAFIVGYSAQSTLGEVFAGLSLNLAQDLHKGDMILIDGVRGEVHEVNWRSVTLYNWLNDSLEVFPNNKITGSAFTNLSRPTKRCRFHVLITVEYSAPPELARRAIEEAFEGSRAVLREPAPYVHVDNINDLGTTLRVFFSFQDMSFLGEAIDEANRAIWNGLRKYGIRPALRRYHLGDRFELAEQPWDERQKEPWEHVEKVLISALETSDAIGSEELRQTIGELERLTFNPPAKIGGNSILARSLFLVVSGTVSLTRPDENGDLVEIQTVHTGQIIDIPSFLDSSDNLTCAWAKTYCVVYVIPRKIVEDLFVKYPTLKKKFEHQKKALSNTQEECFRENRLNRDKLAHEKKRQHLIDDLADEIGLLFRGAGILGRVFGGTSTDPLLEAAMAATALVATADGTLTQSEQDYVENLFDSVGLFQDVGRDTGLARFQFFVDGIFEDQNNGTKVAVNAVGNFEGKTEVKRLVIDMCMAVSAADEHMVQSEVEMILKVYEALSVSPPKNLTNSDKMTDSPEKT